MGGKRGVVIVAIENRWLPRQEIGIGFGEPLPAQVLAGAVEAFVDQEHVRRRNRRVKEPWLSLCVGEAAKRRGEAGKGIGKRVPAKVVPRHSNVLTVVKSSRRNRAGFERSDQYFVIHRQTSVQNKKGRGEVPRPETFSVLGTGGAVYFRF